MRLNTLKSTPGSRPDSLRVGRGIGSGLGKTAGRGHKGQHARAGGYHKVGFEGGQMPLQRRLPKRGFRSMTAKDTAEVRLYALAKVQAEVIDLAALQAANLVPIFASKVKVILSGKLEKPVTLRDLALTQGARAAVLAAGGTILE
ncbi:MAG TPA: 50S ribosomal protein L15 [Candidatus Competibacteraceae bacterium]|nr:50S ribosomal protein L15 [Candidatus Competibacteraceae bacterium]MCP5133906.1 50S ribosomal protein L15 [Gammaproteobacteria bacterium]HPF58383.1 50S ribosomal protein L15 [Candidatus Competibacteraceae bacterium]HRY19230.1 50S ribosomal protein L15 [Candidatus Competibacteraceae bacterium]